MTNPAEALRVVVADDEPLVRQGLRLVLELEPGLEIVAEAADGVDAVALTLEHRPDLVLLDIRMPRLDGIEAARRITADPGLAGTRGRCPHHLRRRCPARRGRACRRQRLPPQEHAARRHPHRGARRLPLVRPRSRRRWSTRLLREYTDRQVTASPELERLTGRETDVLRHIAAGRSNGEIAAELFVSEGTVKTHVAAILRKLAVRDRTQAAVAAYELGLVRPGG